MRSKEFIIELKHKKRSEVVKTAADIAYDDLQQTKEISTGKFPCNTFQLFMPRPHLGARTSYQKHLQNIGNKYSYEPDSLEIKQVYQNWANKNPDIIPDLDEAAPIIPTRINAGAGDNKPNAALWTSTAKKLNDGTYTSDWVNVASSINPSWMNTVGYLYKVASDATILQLNSDYDAEDIYNIFQNLGRGATATRDTHDDQLGFHLSIEHFDGVNHSGRGYGNEFLRRWDCESTAWFNPAVLTLVSEVKINQLGVNPIDIED